MLRAETETEYSELNTRSISIFNIESLPTGAQTNNQLFASPCQQLKKHTVEKKQRRTQRSKKKKMQQPRLMTNGFIVQQRNPKHFLGAGPRRSDYFCNVFHNTELAESKTSTTVLELEASAAQAFPDMLDFIYNQEKENQSSESAVPLRHLASYFCVPPLFEHTNKFIQKDIGTSNIHVYLKEALLYHDDMMIRATMEAAANNWRFLAPNDTSASEPARYLALLPPEKKLEVLQLALHQRAASLKPVPNVAGAVLINIGAFGGGPRNCVQFELLQAVRQDQEAKFRLIFYDDEE
jgi:hypothetical protein